MRDEDGPRCGLCGRELSDPVSRAAGIGPVCLAKANTAVGTLRPPRRRRAVVNAEAPALFTLDETRT